MNGKERYKKYYDSHKEQERARTLAYYHEHRDEMIAKAKERYRKKPKKVKLTAKDYQSLWSEFWFWTNTNLPFITGIMEDLEKEYLERKKEFLKNVEN